jgi:hypothetical protein
LDADDTWHPQKLEIQANWMLKHPNYVLTCHDYEIYSKVKAKKVVFETINERTLSWRRLLFNNIIATRTVMLRKKITQRFPIGVRHAEDYYLWIAALRNESKAMKLCLPLAFSYKNDFGSGGLSKDLQEMHKGVISCLDKFYNDRSISKVTHLLAVTFEKIKYLRRRLLAMKFHQNG